jgi:hypothetical protein
VGRRAGLDTEVRGKILPLLPGIEPTFRSAVLISIIYVIIFKTLLLLL